jgi:hypothetical protein
MARSRVSFDKYQIYLLPRCARRRDSKIEAVVESHPSAKNALGWGTPHPRFTSPSAPRKLRYLLGAASRAGRVDGAQARLHQEGVVHPRDRGESERSP